MGAAIVLGACLYVPLGICGTAVCSYEGHGWLLVKYDTHPKLPNRFLLPEDQAALPAGQPDNRRALIRDRLLTQLLASFVVAGFLLTVSKQRAAPVEV